MVTVTLGRDGNRLCGCAASFCVVAAGLCVDRNMR
jgi:hypothetical protein